MEAFRAVGMARNPESHLRLADVWVRCSVNEVQGKVFKNSKILPVAYPEISCLRCAAIEPTGFRTKSRN